MLVERAFGFDAKRLRVILRCLLARRDGAVDRELQDVVVHCELPILYQEVAHHRQLRRRPRGRIGRPLAFKCPVCAARSVSVQVNPGTNQLHPRQDYISLQER